MGKKRGRYRAPGVAGGPLKHGARALARILRANEPDRRSHVWLSYQAAQRTIADHYGGMERLPAIAVPMVQEIALKLMVITAMRHHVFRRQPDMVQPDGNLAEPLASHYRRWSHQLRADLLALSQLMRDEGIDREPMSLAEYLAGRATPQNPAPDPQGGPTGDDSPADPVAPAPDPTDPPEAA